jgi:hypothetical protein
MTDHALLLDLELGFEDDAPGFDSHPVAAGLGKPGAPPRETSRRRPVDTVREPLTAAQVLARFEAHRASWFAGLADQSDGIERLLREEARLSAELGGLPGTDHRGAWDAQAAQVGASTPGRHDTAADWHPPLWAMAPIVRERGGAMRLRLPNIAPPEVIAQALLDHCPPAWRKRERVRVRLEIETRVYWGARSPDDLSPWAPCSLRGDGVGLAKPLIEIDRGEVRWLTPPEQASTPTISRSVRPGVGLLVAVPVILYERLPRPIGPFAKVVQAVMNWIDRLRGVRRDRDPTFVSRLQGDETYWCQALQATPMDARQWRHVEHRGAHLAPASVPALGHQPLRDAQAAGADGGVHVVLVHGGLSSARGAFEAWLAPQPQGHVGSPWLGMDMFNGARTWRFEHDSFVRLDENITALTELLEKHVVGLTPRGRIVFLTHSRGGAVVRFALPLLTDRWPGWDFHALTAGAPHDGTPVFGTVGQRWVGLAGAVGLLGRAAHGLLGRDEMAKLKNLERGMAGDIPPGFQDLTPDAVRERANGAPLPAQIVAWGSQWRAGIATDWSGDLWRHVIEDFGGFEADGDGLIPLNSAMMGSASYNASPVSHVEYFHHAPTVQQIREHLQPLLAPRAP